MDEIINQIGNQVLAWAIIIVGGLIVLLAVFSLLVNIYLSIKYIVYNHKKNSAGITGKEVARKILDENGLENIKVSSFGSLMFGNSYSHYFHKVRLRRFTWKKRSISSLAIGAEKSALAILDKEGDPDMKLRVRLTPFTYFGPIMVLPLVIIGVLIDYLVFNFSGIVSIFAVSAGLLIYVLAIIFAVKQLKSELKAQERALEILKADGLATEDEIESMRKLFKLYNIDYINQIIMSALQLILKVLEFIAKSNNNGNSFSSSNND